MKKTMIKEINKIIRATNKVRNKDRIKLKRKSHKKVKTTLKNIICKMIVLKREILKDLIMALKKLKLI